MMINHKYNTNFWTIQVPGWLLLVYLIYAQGISAFSYELGVSMGTQESAETITQVGTAFWYGFALGNLVIYIPILFVGLIGHILDRQWGNISLAAGLGITVYWPVVCLVAVVDARDATGWNIENEAPYWIVLPLVSLWGVWGLWALMKNQQT
jgi:hypothetical protein